ncbi:ABC transporter ATP-binding protein [Flavihumibacter petaseus]|uniref:Putative polysaccharide ABC transporter ATP-binding protein n=1 Tax=Flavihumibacter petaseus NBRC 106054 TaxID=1220578 RepID=A0A0E9N5I2_9BACT|nr:ABC transporter ATP-binding protein [Flavihumibacter petaseus]GAO45227.1 putative polysaccharide ABC transporter ATP-binding protein [Flavihumibacter petaseus NBRC 106054]
MQGAGPIIKVDGISKQYRLGKIGTGTLAHDLNRWFYRVRGMEDPYLKIGEKNDRTKKGGGDYVWSLKEVSFTINKGETVGVIGRNGAGKSTLLKLLSRTTAPTTGVIRMRGRVASLLEVGTGFHPELSGRENVFLNGAILGMTKKEIQAKFDEIVDFAGVERYIDTPVKRYSSGMYVRLAFGVAAHLEPEILIVDEVLAVGDAEFQKKALGKMQDVSKGEGRTVLFVSHNMSSIKTLCNKGIMLKEGQLHSEGNIDNVISDYLKDLDQYAALELNDINDRKGNAIVRFKSITFLDSANRERQEFKVGESMKIRIDFVVSPEFANLRTARIDIGINDIMNNRVAWLSSAIYADTIQSSSHIIFEVEKVMLNQGAYNVNLFCDTSMGVADWVQNASRFNVLYDDYFGTGRNIPEAQGFLVTDFKIAY